MCSYVRFIAVGPFFFCGAREHTLDRETNFFDRQGRGPGRTQNGETYVSIAVNAKVGTRKPKVKTDVHGNECARPK